MPNQTLAVLQAADSTATSNLQPFRLEHAGVGLTVYLEHQTDGGVVLSAEVENDPGIGLQVNLSKSRVDELRREALRSLFERAVHEIADEVWPHVVANLR